MSHILQLLTSTLLFIFPGIFLYPFTPKRFLAVERLIMTTFVSIVFWILSYRLLHTINIPAGALLFLFTNTLLLTIIVFRRQFRLHIQRGTFTVTAFVILLIYALSPVAFDRYVPAGADMSMHTYIAEHLLRSGTYPASYEPILPVPQFGRYPTGFPSLIAELSALNMRPTYTNAKFLTAVSYILYTVSLYLFLRLFVHPAVSAGATVLTLGMSRTLAEVITWGGNPTILSIAVILCSLTFFLSSPNYICAILSGIILAGAIRIHPIPIAGFAYIGVPIWICTLLMIRKKKIFIRNSILSLMTFIFLSADMFIPSYQIPQAIKYHSMTFIYKELPDAAGKHSVLYALFQAAEYVNRSVNQPLLYLSTAGGILVILSNIWLGMFTTLPFMIIILLITNSYFRYLPLSYLLYPDRLVLVLLPFLALSIATGSVQFAEIVRSIAPRHPAVRYITVTGLLLIVLFVYPSVRNNYRVYTDSFRFSSVSGTDISGLNWLAAHTQPDDIICNNYGDAGLWIPVISYRRPLVYHTNPFDAYIAGQNIKNDCTYIFIGSRQTYPDSVSFLSAALTGSANAVMVYNLGRTYIYRIVKPGII